MTEVEDLEDLVVNINNRLYFAQHVNRTTLGAYKMLGFVTKTCRDFADPRSRISLYYSLVQPILEYGSVI